jgi:hypothetical protein
MCFERVTLRASAIAPPELSRFWVTIFFRVDVDKKP